MQSNVILNVTFPGRIVQEYRTDAIEIISFMDGYMFQDDGRRVLLRTFCF